MDSETFENQFGMVLKGVVNPEQRKLFFVHEGKVHSAEIVKVLENSVHHALASEDNFFDEDRYNITVGEEGTPVSCNYFESSGDYEIDVDAVIPGYFDGALDDTFVTTDSEQATMEAAKQAEALKRQRKIVAVLSTTVLPLDGTYRVFTTDPEMWDVTGAPHYIGHPATREIVEKLGAVPAETKLFPGLQVGEQALCFSIAQGKSTRAVDGFTTPHQDVALDDLTCRLIRRIEFC